MDALEPAIAHDQDMIAGSGRSSQEIDYPRDLRKDPRPIRQGPSKYSEIHGGVTGLIDQDKVSPGEGMRQGLAMRS